MVMASVAKWLRQWIVIPPFAGSIPVVRPSIKNIFFKQTISYLSQLLVWSDLDMSTSLRSRIELLTTHSICGVPIHQMGTFSLSCALNLTA